MNEKSLVLEAFKLRNGLITNPKTYKLDWWVPLTISNGLTSTSANILYYLIARQSLEPKTEWLDAKYGDIAKHVGVRKSNQSYLLNQLEKQKYIERKCKPGMLRERLIRINFKQLAKVMGLKVKKEKASDE